MNRLQFLLIKLAEECNEVAQLALKTSQFGLNEHYRDMPSNKVRCHQELNDLMAHIEMLNEEFDFGFVPDRDAIEAKKKKVGIFYQYSVDLGMIRLDTDDIL